MHSFRRGRADLLLAGGGLEILEAPIGPLQLVLAPGLCVE